jgi:hypothetical protein
MRLECWAACSWLFAMQRFSYGSQQQLQLVLARLVGAVVGGGGVCSCHS